MKSIYVLFGAAAIYAVSIGIATSIFGKGDVGLWIGGLIGTIAFVGLAGALSDK